MRGTAQEYQAACQGVITSYGEYEFFPADNCILHHTEGSLFLNSERGSHERFAELKDDALTLMTPPVPFLAGHEIVGVYLWDKIG